MSKYIRKLQTEEYKNINITTTFDTTFNNLATFTRGATGNFGNFSGSNITGISGNTLTYNFANIINSINTNSLNSSNITTSGITATSLATFRNNIIGTSA